MKVARRYDALPFATVSQLKRSGLIYHESRSGSTLVANMLTVSNPDAFRVYSEPSVLLKAMRSGNKELVEDVLYMLGRTNNPKEKQVFYKLKSTAVRYIDVMPSNVPWIFLYRDPQEVVASHFNPTEYENNEAICLKERKKPHALLAEISEAFGKDIHDQTDANFCAIRLVSSLYLHSFIHTCHEHSKCPLLTTTTIMLLCRLHFVWLPFDTTKRPRMVSL